MVVTCHKSQSVGSRIEYDNDGKIRNQSKCAREVCDDVYILYIYIYVCVYCVSMYVHVCMYMYNGNLNNQLDIIIFKSNF